MSELTLAEKYIDGLATDNELAVIEDKLRNDAAFKEEVGQLKAVKSFLKAEAKSKSLCQS